MKRKGFTLVEVIVVLLILAILAAIMIPALTGWIDETRAKECMSKMGMVARDYHVCVANEGYGKLGTPINETILLNRAVTDVLSRGASGASYTCPYGGACAVTFSGDKLSVAAITCSLHGTMSFGSGGTTALSSEQINAAFSTALSQETGREFLSNNLNKTYYGSGKNGGAGSGKKDSYDKLRELLGADVLASLEGKSWKLVTGKKNNPGYTLWVYDGDVTTMKANAYPYEYIEVKQYEVSIGSSTVTEKTVQKRVGTATVNQGGENIKVLVD